jgi:hypothetical protein
MGKIEIDIPKDVEQALDAAFPGEDRASAILRLITRELERRQTAAPSPGRGQSLVEMANEIRARMPPISQAEIRRIREEGRP